ncbi:MAG TPA: trehalose-6-phosphate synthase, partial [Minicystis sp.]|nr:trehalose-6-phosphate synthase [Minicystis sp.]
MSRLLIVSNRLPVTVRVEHRTASVVPSAGGLATALRRVRKDYDALWIGWPGDLSRLHDDAQRRDVDERLARLDTAPVHLAATEQYRFYDGFSNGVLWPLFHYLLDKVNLDAQSDWEAYESANRRFAESVAEHHRPGDVVWIHDYQLMLVPELLRRRLPDARIGFFLHIPFPSPEVFRILPWRERILRGLLGADLIGFHTSSYRQHFVASAARVLGLDVGESSLDVDGRRLALGVYPV